MKTSRNDFLIHTNFLTIISINLFYYCEKVFTPMNIWMIGKNSMKHYYLKKKRFLSHLNMEDVTDGDYWHAKRVCEDFEIKNLLAADLFEKMFILKYVS